MEGIDNIKGSSSDNGKSRTVSVVIPTYNRAPLISAAIDSVLNQTFKNVDILVVDDGSTDETEVILRKYDGKIEYIKQLRGGPGKARNSGLDRVKSPYIAFLDSDDMWHETKLESQIAILEKHPEIGFLFSDFCVLKEKGTIIHQGLGRWHSEPIPWDAIFENKEMYSSAGIGRQSAKTEFPVYWGKNLYCWLLRGPYILPSTTIVRRECIDGGVRFPEGVFLYEDWEFFARLTMHWQAGFMDVETTVNRGHDDGVRLTRCSALEAAINRLALIKRVWKSDPEFMTGHGDEVRCIEGDQYLLMAREFLLCMELAKSRSVLDQFERLRVHNNRLQFKVLKILSHLPWVVTIILFLRKLRGMARAAAAKSLNR